MPEPLTPQHDEQIANLQAQLTALQQENIDVRSQLQTCEQSHATFQVELAASRQQEQGWQEQATVAKLIETACDPEQFTRDRLGDSTLEHRLLEATATATNALLTIAPFDAAVNTALQIMGEALDTDRMTVIENFDHPSDSPFVWWRILYEWTSSHAMPQIAHSDLAQGSYEGMEEWYARLSQGQGVSSLVEEMPEPFQSGQAALGVKALHAVPIFVEGEYWGVIGLDDCRAAKQRSATTLSMLKIAADCLGSAIQRQRTHQTMLQAEHDRAAELAKANETLARISSRLADQPDLTAFLSHITIEAIAQLGADAGHLTIFNEQRQTLGTAAHVEQDRLLPSDLIAPEMSIADAAFLQLLFATRKPRYFDLEQEAHLFWTGVIEYHRQHQHRAVLSVPLYGGGKFLGHLGLAFTHDNPISEQGSELVQALAYQAALAIQLTQLAEEAKQAAIAREQEQAAQAQAAELARANTLLRHSLSRLSTNPNLDDILGHLLVELVGYAGAAVGHLFIYDAGQEMLKLKARCRDGQAFCTPAADEPALFQTPIPIEKTQIFTQLRAQPRLAVMNQHEFEGRMWQGVPEWFQAKGYRGTSSCILMVGDRPFGMLAMAFAQPIAFHSVEEELILALAQQIALVLQLTLLSEADKQSAIAREQEQAAQERAAELAKANEALKRSLDALASEPSLDKFLGQVLGAIAEQFDSPLAEYWYHPADTAYIGMMSWQGRVYSRDEIATIYPNHSGVVGHTVPPEQVQGESLQRRKQYFITEDWDTNPFTNYERWYPEHGFHKEINVPMVLGDECIGALVVRLPRGYQITTQQIELAQALAHQATLAVQLTRLAEEVKQAAILEERNRMARDIHDTLAQSFTGIIMQLETLKGNGPIAPDDMQTRLDRVSNLARLGLTEARRSVQALRPQALETTNVVQALRQLLHQMTHDMPIHATLKVEGTPYLLSPMIEENLLRIGQEALTNAIRHGHAHTVTLQLLFEPTVVHLQIRDDGNGFDPHRITPSGFGLVGMQERALQLNGHFHLISHPGQGTQITVTVPVGA